MECEFRKHLVGKGLDIMPVEFKKIVELLAKRRGEKPRDTWGAMVCDTCRRGQFTRERMEGFQAAQEAVDARYCAAEGISDVQGYSRKKAWLRDKALFREVLRELRAEPWRRTLPGLLEE